jgi:hypothetical protein
VPKNHLSQQSLLYKKCFLEKKNEILFVNYILSIYTVERENRKHFFIIRTFRYFFGFQDINEVRKNIQ